MAYNYENLSLEKGMYRESGKTFTQVLEELDPSEKYRNTPLEGLDAYQRQLKRFDIRVKGANSDNVEKVLRHDAVVCAVSGICGQKRENRNGGGKHSPVHNGNGYQISRAWTTARFTQTQPTTTRALNMWRRGVYPGD